MIMRTATFLKFVMAIVWAFGLFGIQRAEAQTLLTSLIPNQAAAGTTVQLRALGSGFKPGDVLVLADPSADSFISLSTTFVSATELRAIIGGSLISQPRLVYITVSYTEVENPYCPCFTEYLPFNVVLNFQLTQIVPDRGNVGSSVALSAMGVGFNQGSFLIWRYGSVETALSTTFISSTELRTTIPATLLTAPGTAEILVERGGPCGSVTFGSPPVLSSVAFPEQQAGCPRTTSRPFTILENLRLTRVDPQRAATRPASGPPQDIVVTGSGFAENALVMWQTGTQTVQLETLGRSGTTELTARISPLLLATPVTALVFVRNPATGGLPNRDSNALQFVVFPNLILERLEPATLPSGSPATRVAAVGTGFTPSTRLRFSSSAGTFTPATQTVDVARNRIEATVGAELLRQVATYRVTAFEGAVVSNELEFRVTQGVTITAITPSTRVAGSGTFQLTITGTGFAQGAQILFGDLQLTPTSATATQLVVTATTPTTAGTVNIRVRVDGVESNSLPLTVTIPAPVISGLDPSQRAANSGPFELRITGQNLAPSPSVTFDGQAVQVSGSTATEVRVQVPNALIQTPKTLSVVVRVGSQDSNALSFTVGPAAPSISALAPASRTAGSGDFQLTITGQNLTPSPVVRFGGQTVSIVGTPTASSIQVQVPGALIVQPGSAPVVVQVGTLSAQAAFSITAPQIPPLAIETPNVMVQPGGNTTTRIILSSPAPVELTGVLALTFTPNAAAFDGFTDPATVFIANGGRSLNFTVASGQTEALIPEGGRVNVGTVAGTIAIRVVSLTALGQGVPGLPGAREIVIPRSAPVLTAGSARIVNSTGGVTVEVSGYAPSRQITQATFVFTIAAGTDLIGSSSFTVPIEAPFTTWFGSQPGRDNGSRFLLQVPFTVEEGDATRITGVTITLTNSEGQVNITATR
jgi:hypothetical protein